MTVYSCYNKSDNRRPFVFIDVSRPLAVLTDGKEPASLTNTLNQSEPLTI